MMRFVITHCAFLSVTILASALPVSDDKYVTRVVGHGNNLLASNNKDASGFESEHHQQQQQKREVVIVDLDQIGESSDDSIEEQEKGALETENVDLKSQNIIVREEEIGVVKKNSDETVYCSCREERAQPQQQQQEEANEDLDTTINPPLSEDASQRPVEDESTTEEIVSLRGDESQEVTNQETISSSSGNIEENDLSTKENLSQNENEVEEQNPIAAPSETTEDSFNLDISTDHDNGTNTTDTSLEQQEEPSSTTETLQEEDNDIGTKTNVVSPDDENSLNATSSMPINATEIPDHSDADNLEEPTEEASTESDQYLENKTTSDDSVPAQAEEVEENTHTAPIDASTPEAESNKIEPPPTEETKTTNETDEEDGPIERITVDYASKSAGAIVLEKSPSFKGTSNLLNSDNDKYAIAPCADKKYLVIGLSEDILVKQVVLANYERYSSHLKDFQVLGSQTFPQATWQDLGTFTAKLGTSKQSFALTEPSWARYLKFRFLTHYGDEHYCTVSQIKVHGSTMLQGFHEQWSISEKEAEEMLHGMEVNGNDEAEVAAASSIEVETAKDTVPDEDVTAPTMVTPESTNKEATDETEEEQPSNEIEIVENDQTEESIPSTDDAMPPKADALQSSSTTQDASDSPTPAPVLSENENNDLTPDVESKEVNTNSHDSAAASTATESSSPTDNLTEEPTHDATKPLEASKTAESAVKPSQGIPSKSKEIIDSKPSESKRTASDNAEVSDDTEVPAQKREELDDVKVDDVSTTAPHSGADSGGEKEHEHDNKPSKEMSSDEESSTRRSAQVDDSASDNDSTIPSSYDRSQAHSTAYSEETDNQDIALLSASSVAAAISKIAPSAACLEGLNFNEFKVKMMARTSKATQGVGGTSVKMEPIFKTLTDEIKALKVNQSIYDQYLDSLLACYQQIVFEMATKVGNLEKNQERRISELEEIVMRMQVKKPMTVTLANMAANRLKEAFATVSAIIRLLSRALPPVLVWRLKFQNQILPISYSSVCFATILLIAAVFIRISRSKETKKCIVLKTEVEQSHESCAIHDSCRHHESSAIIKSECNE